MSSDPTQQEAAVEASAKTAAGRDWSKLRLEETRPLVSEEEVILSQSRGTTHRSSTPPGRASTPPSRSAGRGSPLEDTGRTRQPVSVDAQPEAEPEPEPEPEPQRMPQPELKPYGEQISSFKFSNINRRLMAKSRKARKSVWRRSEGWTLEHGCIAFDGGSRSIRDITATTFAEALQGKLLKISGDERIRKSFNQLERREDREMRVEQLRAVLEILENEWQMTVPPPMVISVTGDAAPFEMREKYHEVFAGALSMASESTGAWVTTGGTATGVMKLVGDSLKSGSTAVVGFPDWGVIKGRSRLMRPQQSVISKRVRDQIVEKRARDDHISVGGMTPRERPIEVPTTKHVLEQYEKLKARGWADPERPPDDLRDRLTYLDDEVEKVSPGKHHGKSLAECGLMGGDGRPNIALRFPELRTGKKGRGSLGRWGPNQAIDCILTRRIPADELHDADDDHVKHTSGMQVAVMWREDDQCWAVPGQFSSNHDIDIMAKVDTGEQMTGELPKADSADKDDQARLVVRKIFELEGIAGGVDVAERNKDLLDEIFKKSGQTLIYRGISDDPRNTDEAWVETSAWHVHCPSNFAGDLAQMYKQSRTSSVAWLDVIIIDEDSKSDGAARIQLYDSRDGHRYDPFASHREFIELAVFGHVLGHRDMPFVYKPAPVPHALHTDGEPLKEIACLDPNHTHYICIDDGTNGKFGTAVNFRADLESFISYYDADARVLHTPDLVDYFAHCIDQSALDIGGHRALVLDHQLGLHQSQVIRLPGADDTFPHDKALQRTRSRDLRRGHEIMIDRTASDGTTHHSYKLTVYQDPDQQSSHQMEEYRPESISQLAQDHVATIERNGRSPFTIDGKDIRDIRITVDGRPHKLEFDHSQLEYALYVPEGSVEVRVKVQIAAQPRINYFAAVPVIVLCFGGGPGTLNQLDSAGLKPIIMVRGSERAASFLDDWCQWETKIAAAPDSIDTSTLRTAQREQAERCLREDAAHANNCIYTDVAASTTKPDWWKVSSFVKILTKLGQHPQLSFFDMNRTLGGQIKKTLRLNPMLPKILDGVVKSTLVASSVKIPFAIRINDAGYVDVAFSDQGLKKKRGRGEEWSEDARPLIYAAFHDRGKIVDKLIDAGFDLSALDALVSLEVQKDLATPHLTRGNKAPEWWVEKHRHSSLEADLIQGRWRKLSVDAKKKIYRTVEWSMMPSLQGWTFEVQSTSKGNVNLKILRMLKTRYQEGQYPPHGLQERTFVVDAPTHLKGTRIVAVDEKLESSQNLWCNIKEIAGCKDVQVELSPMFHVNMTEWLPLSRESRFYFPTQRHIAARERKLAVQAFRHWLPLDQSAAKDNVDPNRRMNDLHRLYWAIRSNRNNVAEVLLHRCKQPIIAGLFAAKLYQEARLPRSHVPDVTLKAKYMPSAMRLRCESYATDVLEHANLDQGTAAFDEYVFYSTEMEGSQLYKTFLNNSEQALIENESIRDALILMGVPPNQDVTRIDLALMCSAKGFLNCSGVTHFLDQLWKQKSENGQYCQWVANSYIPISAQLKGIINILGFLSMLIVVMSFYNSLPERGGSIESVSGLEVTFWVWTLTYVYNELEQFTTLGEYIKTVENCLDVIIVVMFIMALVARALHFAEVQNWTGSQRSLDALAVLLCINLLFCWLRFLILLQMQSQVGTMLIVFGKILKKDVWPFLMFATVVIFAFETAVQYVSWMLNIEHNFGMFVMMFLEGEFGHFTAIDTDPELSWESGNESMQWNVTISQVMFFLVMNVVLMNLLIAMYG